MKGRALLGLAISAMITTNPPAPRQPRQVACPGQRKLDAKGLHARRCRCNALPKAGECGDMGAARDPLAPEDAG